MKLKLSKSLFWIFALLPLVSEVSFSQSSFRITGNYSIKSKTDSADLLVMGKFYYDSYLKKIVHANYFPSKETWVTHDTTIYKFVGVDLESRNKIPPISSNSLYALALENKLSDYGLGQSMYKRVKVETKNDMVISTWEPQQFDKFFGNIVLSNKNKQLNAIIFYSAKGEILKKQFFENYENIRGVLFPTKVVEITYLNNKEYFKVSTYKDIIIDDLREDNMYDYPLPAL